MSPKTLLAATLAASLTLAACGGDDRAATDMTLAPTSAAESTTSISIEGRVIDDIEVGPDDFSDPLSITNELYPVTGVPSVIMLGEDEGEPLRIEVALMPETKTIEWNGGSTETIQSQFMALVDGELAEVAYDWLAQDDAGNVWYFGEDVFNYEDGEVADTSGSWLAGVDGPPGMIMPADPHVGDVFHPENIEGSIFEEDFVLSVDETVEGPSGSIEGAMKVQETVEGDIEIKYWAPGYGEFHAIVPGIEDVIVVCALPNDAQDEAVPATLSDLRNGARVAFDLARSEDWTALRGSVDAMAADWEGYDAPGRDGVPEQFVDAFDTALDELATATEDEDGVAAAEAAVDLELAALDVVMTHGTPPDAQRIGALQNGQILATEAGDGPQAASIEAVIAAIEART